MSKLIEKRLAALEPGAQVELKFNDGDTEQKLAGVVTDTDHEEGMMVRTEQGEEVYLAFREVLVFKQLGTAPAVSVTPPTPPLRQRLPCKRPLLQYTRLLPLRLQGLSAFAHPIAGN